MEGVAAGLGGNEDSWSRACAEFRGVVVGEHLEFVNGIDGGENADAAGGQFVVVVAVEQPVGTVGAGAADRERKRPTGRDFAACGVRKEPVGIGFRHGAGGESGELHEVAAVQGELGDLLRIDDLSESRIGGGGGGGGGGNLHGRGDGGRVQTEIELAGFVDLQAHVFGLCGLKSLVR